MLRSKLKLKGKLLILFSLLLLSFSGILVLASHASSYSTARLKKRKMEKSLLKSAERIRLNQLKLFHATIKLTRILRRSPKSKKADQLFNRLPLLLRSVNSSMAEFQKKASQLGIYSIFKGRLILWREHAASFKKELKNTKAALSPAAAWHLHKITNNMVINFMVITNVLDILKNSVNHPVPLGFTPPAHPVYARKDKNPTHTIWPNQATLLELLLGKVKGEQYPYKNSMKVPYCLRCHSIRKGISYYWFDRTNKTIKFAQEMIKKQKEAALKPKPVKIPVKVAVKKKPVVIRHKPLVRKPVKVAVKRKPVVKRKPAPAKPKKIQLAFLPPSEIASIKRTLHTTFDTASAAASLHENLLSFTQVLSVSAKQTANNLSNYGPNMLKVMTYKVYKLGGMLPQRLDTLGSTMFTLKRQLRTLHIYSLFTQKFNLWDQKLRVIKTTDQNLQSKIQELHPAPASKAQLSSILQSAAGDFQKIHEGTRILASEFNLIANVVYILKAVPPSAIVPPPGRVPGLSWSAYRAMTGDILIKNLNMPPHICDRIPSPCNSIYSVRDRNPNHIWWPNQATLKDFLLGRVKGQMWAYKDNPNIPYCQRCHTMREGKPIMWWNSIKTSSAMAAGLGALEKAIKR